MKLIIAFLLWCLLLVLCWPVAVLALVLLPVVVILSIPFRLGWAAVSGVISLVAAILHLPARWIGGSK